MRGRLVIAADIGGLPEVLGDTGLKFPPGNAVSRESPTQRNRKSCTDCLLW
jgi:hypothetical protein